MRRQGDVGGEQQVKGGSQNAMICDFVKDEGKVR